MQKIESTALILDAIMYFSSQEAKSRNARNVKKQYVTIVKLFGMKKNLVLPTKLEQLLIGEKELELEIVRSVKLSLKKMEAAHI